MYNKNNNENFCEIEKKIAILIELADAVGVEVDMQNFEVHYENFIKKYTKYVKEKQFT